jgi:outer membrane protein assembly factor BamB
MTVAPLSVSAAALTSQSAPTGTFQISLNGPRSVTTVYLTGKFSQSGVAGVMTDVGGPLTGELVGPSNLALTTTIQFKPPASLGAGIYEDTVQVFGCYDQACTQPVANSPQTVQIQYAVTVPVLGLTYVSPTSVAVGGPSFTLTVLGANFTTASTVQWNGSARTTTFVAPGELLAQITAVDVAAIGTASVTVQDPTYAAGTGTTAAQTVTISPVSIDAVAFQINPAHTGAVSFASVAFPASSTWSVDVGGLPSYALIAQGRVFVTVTIGGSGSLPCEPAVLCSSQLIALDQTTGATVWGPVAIGGLANATYDAGKVFVISSPTGIEATMEAFDATTGQLAWSTLLAGQTVFSAAPTAADGFVYTAGAEIGGTLYAVNETTGAVAWTQNVANGDNSDPAVTADGVYVTYPCQTYNIRPATGELIWNNSTGCDGGGGATPVVANQLIYSPNGASGYDGLILNAETGTSAGTYAADTPAAFTTTAGYFLQSGTLRGITLSNNTVNWSFAGDGKLVGSPIAVNHYVFIGSSSGNLYALDGSTGQQVWQVTLSAPVASNVLSLPMSGLAAGDGLLVVPAGTKVTAYTLSTNP